MVAINLCCCVSRDFHTSSRGVIFAEVMGISHSPLIVELTNFPEIILTKLLKSLLNKEWVLCDVTTNNSADTPKCFGGNFRFHLEVKKYTLLYNLKGYTVKSFAHDFKF
jgi:hypothetical protein